MQNSRSSLLRTWSLSKLPLFKRSVSQNIALLAMSTTRYSAFRIYVFLVPSI